MKRSTSFPLLALLILLLSGCGIATRQSVSSGKAREQRLRTQIEALRAENAQLMRRQEQAVNSMGALQKQLVADRNEQNRFREMMATNFDLLEQSVAVSLSKSIGRTPVVEPKELKLPPPRRQSAATGAKANHRPAPPTVKALQRPKKHAGSKAGVFPGGSPSTVRDGGAAVLPKPGIFKTSSVITGAAGAGEGNSLTAPGAGSSPESDPDLTPPQQGRKLRAHREAKPLYDKGFAHFARSEFPQAIRVYRNFLERFPGDTYSDNAQFWIGESYFRQKRWSLAEKAYRNVLKDYDHRGSLEGYKTPEAIFRIGATYLKRKDARRAHYYFANVAERFPTSSSGRKAQRELASMIVNTARNRDGNRMAPGS